MKLVIIKYNSGNVRSVSFAFERLGISALITDNPEEILSADKVIFPGVGEASTAMNYLKERKLNTLIPTLKQPVLGICLGMQIMCKHSEEGDTNCMGIFDTNIKRFVHTPNNPKLKVPQIGWNTIYNCSSSLFKNIPENEYMYFVHSYYAERCEHSIALTNYCLEYASALHKNNFYAVQFHPEKSSTAGELILKNFIQLT